MGAFLPDVAVSVPDRPEAARHYSEVCGPSITGSGERWAAVQAGPFCLYLCTGEPNAPVLFAFATDDVEGPVSKVVERGGEVLLRRGGEVFVRDRYGVAYCVEPG
jgi:predicted enzyme related to lactoylglutathione lyase